MTAPLRIFVGTTETAGFVRDLGEGFRALGHQVTTGLASVHAGFHEQRYSMDLGDDLYAVRWPTLGEALARGGLRRPGPRPPLRDPQARMRWILSRHDVFVLMYTGLRPDAEGAPFVRGLGREYPLLRRLGRRIVTWLIGPEGRHASSYDQQRALLGHDTPALGEMASSWRDDPLARPLRNLRRAEAYSDLLYSQPGQAALALRPYHHLYAPIDLRTFRCEIPQRAVPVVVHAPSESAIKGTREVVAALEALRSEGVRFELRLVQGVPNRVVRRELRAADLVVDQLYLPMYGRLAVEAMSSGCALATSDRRDLEPVPGDRPIVHVDRGNVRDVLRALLRDAARRRELALRGRDFVERHHAREAVAGAIVRALEQGVERCPPEHRPTFFARHYALPPGARVPASLRDLSARVVRRFGLAEGVDPRAMASRGLIAWDPADDGGALPRWRA